MTDLIGTYRKIIREYVRTLNIPDGVRMIVMRVSEFRAQCDVITHVTEEDLCSIEEYFHDDRVMEDVRGLLSAAGGTVGTVGTVVVASVRGWIAGDRENHSIVFSYLQASEIV
jgi:hypothetical protein